MKRLRVWLQAIYAMFGGTVFLEAKPICRWTRLPNGQCLWLIDGYRRADGYVYRLPPVNPIFL